MRESRFQSIVKAKMLGAGAMVFNVHGHAMQAPGWPDLQVYSPLWTGHLELKTMTGKPTVLQLRRIRQLRKMRQPAFILREDGALFDPDSEVGRLDVEGNGRDWLDELRRYSDMGHLLTSTWLRNVGLPTVEQTPFTHPKYPL
tara:strand:+ start:294 stop:722 length:429 start_codon:yes stop_codon:yes gene_type:complete